MTIGLLGNKIGMTQIFDKNGNVIPVTILKVGPSIITQIKTKEKDGYNAIQVGYYEVLAKKLNKPKLGHLRKSKIKPLKYLKEFKIKKENKFYIGQTLNVNLFSIGQYINIKGKSIGKGFSGLQKRHNFKQGPLTHGSKNYKRPGSIGMGTTPGRVFPGKKMAGQLGNKILTIKNCKIIQINVNENILIIKGSIPGKPRNLLSIMLSN